MVNYMQTDQKIVSAEVMLDEALDRPYSYSIPSELKEHIKPGTRVRIPLRSSTRLGTVVALSHSTLKLKPIIEMIEGTAHFSPELLCLAHWIATYYCTSLRKVLKLILPPSVHVQTKEKKQWLVKATLSLEKLRKTCEELRIKSTRQAEILDVLLKNPKGILLSKLREETGCSQSPIDTLVTKKILKLQSSVIDRSIPKEFSFFRTKPKVFNEEQQSVFDAVSKSLSTNTYSTHLVHGITGSGKTEIYLQAIDQALSENKSVIFLVPEIALTSQTVERLCARFEGRIALIHHRLSAGERRDAWHAMEKGEIPIVVGARSAIFAPLPNLGLIIVDEEHDSSYKQSDEMPCYHARDVSTIRAQNNNATVILGSATPALESYRNALQGKYKLHSLLKRATQAELPHVHIVDMKREKERSSNFVLFSEKLIGALKERFEKGEQSLLFLNRRGYHSLHMCRNCSHVIACPNCSVNLTYHKSNHELTCHLCSYQIKPPPKCCPSCNKEETMQFKGFGTEMVEKSLNALFPEMRTLRLDRDTTRHKGSHELLFKQFRSGKADVMIGTQMIAKGLHFPSVTLVAILNTDSALNIPDFRASETVFQLITQVAGRSGRSDLPGEVIIQTFMPDNESIQLGSKQDFLAFYEKESAIRALFDYPPESRMAKIVISSPIESEIISEAHTLRTLLLRSLPAQYELFPILPCGYAKIKNRYRYQFLIKGKHLLPFSQIMKKILENHRLPKEMRILIDIDPSSTYF